MLGLGIGPTPGLGTNTGVPSTLCPDWLPSAGTSSSTARESDCAEMLPPLSEIRPQPRSRNVSEHSEMPSESKSAACTVYSKSRWRVPEPDA